MSDFERFETGAIRDRREGKGRFDLISPILLWRLARVYELGARRYGARNWERGVPVSRLLDSAMRHLNQYMLLCLCRRRNVPIPEHIVDPNEDHLAHAVWNLTAIMQIEFTHPELNDMEKDQTGEKFPLDTAADVE